MDSPQKPGALLQKERERRCLTQGELADEIGLKNPASVSAIETGKDKASVELALRIQVWSGGRLTAAQMRPDLATLIEAAFPPAAIQAAAPAPAGAGA